MRICFVYKEDYPWDVRVEKIVVALAEAGHDVTLISRNTKRRATHEEANGFRIRRFPPLPAWCRKLNTLIEVPFFLNPFWFLFLYRSFRAAGADIVVVRDLPLMPTAIWAARGLHCRVVFDMAECYPLMYRSIIQFSKRRLASLLLKNPALASVLERYSVRNADHVLVMIEESRDRLLAMGFDPHKISIVSNTPTTMGGAPKDHRDTGVLRLLYVGFITRIRGLDTLLRGIHDYYRRRAGGPEIEFHAVGVGDAREELIRMAEDLGIAESVSFPGWCEQDLVDRLYAESDVGVLTYRQCPHWNTTIPNKLFDYMRAGMPVLATDIIPIMRIIESEHCGVIFADGDAAACGDALAKLAAPTVRNELGHHGYRAVQLRYHWELDRERLLQIIAGI